MAENTPPTEKRQKRKKTDQVVVRLSPEMREGLEQRAAQYGFTLSEYARALILADVKKAESKGFLVQLDRAE